MSLLIEVQENIERAQKGDQGSQAFLYDRFADRIYRYIAYRVPREEAEDITAEVFVNMIEGLPKYKITEVPFDAWLYRIASARIADFYRQNRSKKTVEIDESIFDTHPLVNEETFVEEEQYEELRTKFDLLSEEQRVVLFLRFVERKSHDEVAKVLGKTSISIRSIQHRALKELAKLLGKQDKTRHYLRGNDKDGKPAKS